MKTDRAMLYGLTRGNAQLFAQDFALECVDQSSDRGLMNLRINLSTIADMQSSCQNTWNALAQTYGETCPQAVQGRKILAGFERLVDSMENIRTHIRRGDLRNAIHLRALHCYEA